MFFRNATLHSARRFLVLGCLMISPLVVQEGRSCICFSVPLCNQQPDFDGKRTVFVGYVTDFFPASLDVYRSFEESARDEDERRSFARSKELMLQRWGAILSPREARSITLADTGEQLRAASDIGVYARRIRFRVTEWLEGSETTDFVLFTDATSCGYSFQMGKEYLVVSQQYEKTDRWWTFACSRTAPVESVEAQEDLKALRRWREGLPLAPRVYGQVFDSGQQGGESTSLPSARVRLVGASSDREVISDLQGRFAFDDLVPAKYRVEITAPIALGSPREIDLSRGGCFEAAILIELDAAGTRYEILGSGPPEPDIASPAEIPLERRAEVRRR